MFYFDRVTGARRLKPRYFWSLSSFVVGLVLGMSVRLFV